MTNIYKKVIISVLCLLVIFILIVSALNLWLNPAQLQGIIAMNHPDGNGKVALVSLPDKSLTNTELGGSNDVHFSPDGTRLILTVFNKIYEYDLSKRVSTVLYEEKSQDELFDAQYIPGRQMISFICNNTLYTFDLTTKEVKAIINVGYLNYTVDPTGESIYYVSLGGNRVLKYSFANSESYATGIEGGQPRVSKDGRYIAYRNDAKDQNVLVIRDIVTGDEWSRSFQGLKRYCFSPDGRYIAVVCNIAKPFHLYGQRLVVWDFQNNKSCTLIDDIAEGAYREFDWFS